MKKVLVATMAMVAAMVAGVQSARAQRGEADGNQMSIRVAGYEVMLEAARTTPGAIRRGSGYYGGRIGTLEIGFNGFRETSGAYALYPDAEKGFMDLRQGKSIHFTFNVWTFSTALTRGNVLGVTGAIGFTTNNYTFESPSAYSRVDGVLHPVEAGHELKKSKLNTFAIHVPLALEINPTRSFFFSVGGWVDLVTGAHMKWKAPREKLRGLSPNFLQAGVTARVGWRNAYLLGSYNFVEIFKEGRGPVLNPWTLGVGLGF